MAARVGSIFAEITADPQRFTKALNESSVAVVGFERRSNRSFRQAEAQATRSFDKMGNSGQRFASVMAANSARIGSFGKAIVGGLAVGAGVGALEGIREAAIDSTRSILEMGDQAKIAGVKFGAFQQLKFVAEQNRIGIDALTDGLKELSLRADEFIKTGAGSSGESFQRLGYNAVSLAEKLKEPDQLFLEIIGKLQKLDEAAQIRIADEVFGGSGGEQFVKLISLGEKGIRDQIKAANDLGIVLDEEMVRKAEEVNRKFAIVATTISTNIKAAIVDAMAAWNDFLDTYKKLPEQQTRTLDDQQAKLGLRRVDLENKKAQIANGDSSNPFYWNEDGPLAMGRIHEIELELAKIADEERKIIEEQNRRLRALNDASPAPGPDNDDGRRRTLYRPADQGDRADSRDYTVAAQGGMLDLIGAAEGTDRGRGYNETLGYGKFTGGDKNLVLMSLDDIDALQTKMLADPSNTFNSSALGRYQITRTTLRGLRDRLGLSGSDTFDAATQDRLAEQLLRQRGNDPAGLRNEWEGLRNVGDETIRGAFDQTSVAMPGLDSGIVDAREKAADRVKIYDEMIAKANAFVASQGVEQSALGMTSEAASRLKHEQDLLNEARQAGLELSPEQLANLKALAAQMAAAEQQTRSLTTSQQELRRAAQEFAQIAKGVTKGFITDLVRGTSAADALKNALSRIADTLLDGALDSIFGGGSVGGTGLLGKFLGFDEGGYTGDGAKSEPKGVVHAGEFVLTKKATERAGVGNLYALMDYLETGSLGSFLATTKPGYETGGYVGTASLPSLPSPREQDSGAWAAAGGRQAMSQPRDMHITLGWSKNADGQIKPFIEEISHKQAVSVTRAGLSEYDRSLPGKISDTMDRTG
ncbi:hypothetical protein [Pararhizobium gei]|uniref:hypothetical protein n=1 Tax=Pararhizobium gei TaxID=1395951 RepID=UPI0023D9AD9C|nr:hypothetical protein [Rhizobium gei]